MAPVIIRTPAFRRFWRPKCALRRAGDAHESKPPLSFCCQKQWEDNPEGPTIEYMELCSLSPGRLGGRGVCGRMDTRVCMAESLCCSPETITRLSANRLDPNTK